MTNINKYWDEMSDKEKIDDLYYRMASLIRYQEEVGFTIYMQASVVAQQSVKMAEMQKQIDFLMLQAELAMGLGGEDV